MILVRVEIIDRFETHAGGQFGQWSEKKTEKVGDSQVLLDIQCGS